jgi:hypothetical protein
MLDRHGEDPHELARSLDGCTAQHVEPFYLDQAANDGARLEELRHTLFGAPAPAPPPLTNRVSFTALRTAMLYDATLFRAFWRVLGMLVNPEDVYTDPDVVARVRDVLRSLDRPAPIPQPSRAALQDALAGA